MLRNRVQASQVLPVLTGILSGAIETIASVKSIHKAIDQGKPLIDAVAKYYGVRPSIVRSIIRKQPSEIGYYWEHQPGRLLKLLDKLPPEHHPKTSAEWNTMNKADRALRLFNKYSVDIHDLYFRQFAARGFNLALSKNQILVDPSAKLEAIKDFMGSLNRVLCHQKWHGITSWPAMQYKIDSIIAAIICNELTSISIMRVLLMSEKWHASIILESSKLWRKTHKKVQWLSLINAPFRCKDHQVVSLADSNALAEEGARLNHCVAARLEDCIREIAHIFSIRTLDDKSLSTLEIEIVNQHIPQIIEHKGKDNQQPDTACQITASEFIAFLNARLNHHSENRIDYFQNNADYSLPDLVDITECEAQFDEEAKATQFDIDLVSIQAALGKKKLDQLKKKLILSLPSTACQGVPQGQITSSKSSM
ncbi:MAG: hypothetical protein A2W28_02650 [Gammaproteobacteria bacterium RBG_16_51_14]|nr:MAG: hypothetical protein A2W28_02650 [Gammaproteobacteria bacterium RBG_16_51_14]